ncbi:protein kinase C iota type-like [Cavia porcellus]|uniref:protein kinase C iota type-like n=1 Tax=Cavia porcellus TaxID=10141 RepID=UPI002FE2EA5D
MVSPRPTDCVQPPSRYPHQKSVDSGKNDTETKRIHGQVSTGPRTLSSSGQLSAELAAVKTDRPRCPEAETNVTVSSNHQTLRNLQYDQLGRAIMENYLAGRDAQPHTEQTIKTVRPPSPIKPCMPVFLHDQPFSDPFFPSTSMAYTTSQQAQVVGGDKKTTSLEILFSSEGNELLDTCSFGNKHLTIHTSSPAPKYTEVSCVSECTEVPCLPQDGKVICIPEDPQVPWVPKTTLPRMCLDQSSWDCLQKDTEALPPSFPEAPQVFGVQEQPKTPSPEDKSICCRASGHLRKVHCANGHTFRSKRFSKRANCAVCSDPTGGFGRKAYKCMHCKILVHKKCHTLVRVPCKHHTGEENGRPLCSSALKDFDFLRVLGRGSYGKVLLARHKTTDHLYAMKVVRKDDENLSRLQVEKQIMEKSLNHPYLVGLHSCIETPTRFFFILDYISGGDLTYHLQQFGIFPEAHVRFYSGEISLAIKFLHEHEILHRDLKLENLLLDADGHIKVTDFNLCKAGLKAGEKTNSFCGTLSYLAPEIIRGESYGFSVDWWNLGTVMFEMMVGEPPYPFADSPKNSDLNTYKVLQSMLEREVHIPHHLSVEARSILKGLLKKEPEGRLGCHPQRGFIDIKEHPFFNNLDWNMMEKKQVPPPFKPSIGTEFGIENFDPEFTNKPVQLTPDDSYFVNSIDEFGL